MIPLKVLLHVVALGYFFDRINRIDMIFCFAYISMLFLCIQILLLAKPLGVLFFYNNSFY